ncbi:hypothetical protein CEXT_510821 [Caerostris extrusa]|uniref:Uncharacterized protein n=1 Tax=Caerostris extrusa TaxID=172846 RepID=A0AAV4WLA8_CAEEX|nr:hypothetical protein CEXT_510821 [Caerostris extrusa]
MNPVESIISGTTMDQRSQRSCEWIHVLRPLDALEPGLAECPPSHPANSRPRLGAHKSAHRWRWARAHKSAHHWRWELILGRNRADLIFRMRLMGRRTAMSYLGTGFDLLLELLWVFEVADMRNLVNVS